METLTIWQLASIFCAYLLVTVGLPAFALGKKLQNCKELERFLLYFMVGNFYVINLVYLLQLLHISHPITLVLGTLLPAAVVRAMDPRRTLRELASYNMKSLRMLVGGQLGPKTAVGRAAGKVRRQLPELWEWAVYFSGARLLHWALTVLLLVALWRIYGVNLLEHFGYKASDILVHNYWVNAMGENDIFVAGVYPYGFHCVIYYLHAVFGLKTFVLLRIFAFVQTVMLHLMLLFVLRLCCRSKYAAYVGTAVFAASTWFKPHTYSRYYASLPQEFGMIFILPAVYFGFAFFEARRGELEDLKNGYPAEGEKEKKWPRSRICLAGFCMSFSMTLAVHFYGTMVAGIFCLAMALGYCFLFFRKQYFFRVVCTVSLSVAIAVLPMLAAYLGGTPLQGSLGWGMNIIKGQGSNAEKEENKVLQSDATDTATATGEHAPGEAFTVIVDGEEITVYQGVPVGHIDSELQSQVEQELLDELGIATRLKAVFDAVSDFGPRAWEAVRERLTSYVFDLPGENDVQWTMVSFLALVGLGILYLLLREQCYGAMLISTGIYMVLMCVMLTAGTFGLPSLMDGNRGSIYFSYSTPIVAALLLDALLFFPYWLLEERTEKAARLLRDGASLLCLAALLGHMINTDQIREPRHSGGQEMDEAVICLTNILEEEKNFTWTIVSANDELRMGSDYGYHYETITFLEEMEGMDEDTMIRIPTQVVYFFIEKVPQDYNVTYSGSGQPVSVEGADRQLPANKGIGVYQGEKRWIVMSRMYYWAEAFRQLCPNDMQVYMETDSFVCYRIEQNPYRLYNFAIDYDYNLREYETQETQE